MTSQVCARPIGPDRAGARAPVSQPIPQGRVLAPAPVFVPGMGATILGHDREYRCRLVWDNRALPGPSCRLEIR